MSAGLCLQFILSSVSCHLGIERKQEKSNEEERLLNQSVQQEHKNSEF